MRGCPEKKVPNCFHTVSRCMLLWRYISLFGVAAIGFSHTGTHEFATWTLIITQLILLLFVIGKIIFDSIRCKNALWGISIGLVFYISLIAVMMLTTDCMWQHISAGGFNYFCLVLI